MQQAEDQLANLQSRRPSRPRSRRREANLRDAEAARDKMQEDLQRNQALLKTGSATVQIVDQEDADLRSAQGQGAGDDGRARHSSSAHGPAGGDRRRRRRRSMPRAPRSTQARWRLDQRYVVSPAAGVVADVLARPGETLAAGAPVVSLLPPENIFVRFFVPEPELARVHVGDHSRAAVRQLPPTISSATVSFIAPQAEYTPPFIYSESTRGKFVFLAEARPPPAQAALLNPGQPVTVRPHRADAPP